MHIQKSFCASNPSTQSEVISVLAEIGVIILLFEIGLESDLRQLKEVGIQATVVACVGVAEPVAAGTAGLMLLFHVAAIPAIFAGVALTATSIDLLVPIFFVTVGACADLGVLNPAISENRAALLIAVFLMGVAIIGKLITGWAVFGQLGINRWAIGVGMIPRGEVGLVFAGIGSSSGVLDKPLEVSIIIMVILTPI